uniref:Cmp-n-acetylneuraminate-beta-galactosamide-alpha--sialyltransferase 1 n=1 Tax=Tetraselmis sp. GSL018 TaxID=582737 RepID=A0A061RC82_9CHLO|mmetsp:Transcript_832/g.2002  ORF Transcript_832/g.2002 Transcript_832/m.2002 type:complete len:732 (-) Transcript_832:109-2304(-)
MGVLTSLGIAAAALVLHNPLMQVLSSALRGAGGFLYAASYWAEAHAGAARRQRPPGTPFSRGAGREGVAGKAARPRRRSALMLASILLVVAAVAFLSPSDPAGWVSRGGSGPAFQPQGLLPWERPRALSGSPTAPVQIRAELPGSGVSAGSLPGSARGGTSERGEGIAGGPGSIGGDPDGKAEEEEEAGSRGEEDPPKPGPRPKPEKSMAGVDISDAALDMDNAASDVDPAEAAAGEPREGDREPAAEEGEEDEEGGGKDLVFEQSNLLCLQPANVAALTGAQFCSRGNPKVMGPMWTAAGPGQRNIPKDMQMELNALKDSSIFFPVPSVSRARAMSKVMASSRDAKEPQRRAGSGGGVRGDPLGSPRRGHGRRLSSDGAEGRSRDLLSQLHLPRPAGGTEQRKSAQAAEADVREKQAFERTLGRMKDVLQDAQGFLSKLRRDAAAEGREVDRDTFIHQGNINDLRFDENATEALRPMLPVDENKAHEGHRFRTCAVVGNSGIARLTAFGSDIDAHEAVFRMNQAPATNGCQLYVGGRTTVRLLNARWLHKLAHGTMRHLPLERGVTALITRYDAREVRRLLQQLNTTGRSDVKVRLMSQALKARAQKLLQYFRFYLMAFKGFRDGSGISPSTGLLAILSAMQMCEQVTLYAFGLWRQHSHRAAERQRMYHYFHSLYGKKEVDADAHSMDAERMLFKFMNEAGLVSMCSFKNRDGTGDGWELERKGIQSNA